MVWDKGLLRVEHEAVPKALKGMEADPHNRRCISSKTWDALVETGFIEGADAK